MIQQAIAADDPVIFMEPKRRYWQTGRGRLSPTPPALVVDGPAERHRRHADRLRTDRDDLP